MESIPLTFEQLPAYVFDLGQKVDDLTALLRAQSGQAQPTPDRHLTVEELSEYLPGHPAVSTLRGKAQRREIPFRRRGKRLLFLQSEIDQWLKEGRTATVGEQAQQYDQSRATRAPRTRRNHATVNQSAA